MRLDYVIDNFQDFNFKLCIQAKYNFGHINQKSEMSWQKLGTILANRQLQITEYFSDPNKRVQ